MEDAKNLLKTRTTKVDRYQQGLAGILHSLKSEVPKLQRWLVSILAYLKTLILYNIQPCLDNLHIYLGLH